MRMDLSLTLRSIFFVVLLIPSLAQAYTETFYVCNGGNGSLPETATCATAYDEADFNSSRNWDTDDSNDGKIGPNDVVYLMDDGGAFDRLTVRQPGLPGKPITIMTAPGDDVTIDTSDETGSIPDTAAIDTAGSWLSAQPLEFGVVGVGVVSNHWR